MKKTLFLFCFLIHSIVVFGQMSNNAFRLNNDYGDLNMRRYISGDLIWKRALVSGATKLHINYGGDFAEGTRIMGSKLIVDGNVGIGTTNTSNGILTINGDNYNGLRIENDTPGKEASMRFRVKNSSGSTFHADISTFYRNNKGFLGFKVPHNNTPGSGYKFIIDNLGNVGIGTTIPDSRLTVKGKIHAEEVRIDLNVPAPDYVFTKDYDLPTIEQIQQYIIEQGHLPNIPSAKEMETNGIELGLMNMKLLEKIEELTLYTIEQENKIKSIHLKVESLEKQDSRIRILEEKLNTLLEKTNK
ncbi:hypothetical protein [Aquimarina sp. 2304DJ70-9]|uniref:hypothetical protein n=1 Tax=Aquimarina penaris TaxID=3231044 RepID=UPI0034621B39